MRIGLIVKILAVWPVILFAQPSDSLINILLDKTLHDTVRCKAGVEFLTKTRSDDTNFYPILLKTQNLISSCKNNYYIALFYFNKGGYLSYTDSYDSARFFLNKAIEILKKLNKIRYLAASYSELGNTYCYQGDYSKCLDLFLKAKQYILSLHDTNWLAILENNIANIYYLVDDTVNALKHYKYAYNLAKAQNNPYAITLVTTNLANIYTETNLLDSAVHYFNLAIKTAKKHGYYEHLSEALTNLAKVYLKAQNLQLAEKYITQAIALHKKIKNKNGLAAAYGIYSIILKQKNNLQAARDTLVKGLNLAKRLGTKELLKDFYLQLAKIDSAQGNYQEALQSYLKYLKLKDSLNQSQLRKKIAELQTYYDLELKERENKLLKERQAHQKLIIQRQRTVLVLAIVSLLLMLSMSIWIYRSNKIIKKINKDLMHKNQLLVQQKKKILAQKQLIAKHRRSLTDSIKYAEKIQQALFPDTQILNHFFTEWFIVYKPRDIVSGDFYWIQQLDQERILIAVGDCTGHGVPGAFMSILSLTLLKETVSANPNLSAAEILNKLRDKIKLTLLQTNKQNYQDDGIDIALIIYNKQQKIINFAGAYRPMYIFSANILNIYSGDRQPIGAYIKESKFSDHFINVEPNNMIYLFTDGLTDLYSLKYRKFTVSRFKQLLRKIHQKTATEQKQIILNLIKKWKQGFKQIDDIIVLGLRI